MLSFMETMAEIKRLSDEIDELEKEK